MAKRTNVKIESTNAPCSTFHRNLVFFRLKNMQAGRKSENKSV